MIAAQESTLFSDLLQPLDDGSRTRAEAHVRSLVPVRHVAPPRGSHLAPPGNTDPIRPIGSIGIIGAGMMGTAIAGACVTHGLSVAMTDNNPESLHNAAEAIAREIAGPDKPFDIALRDAERLVNVTGDDALVARSDLVLESVIETVPGKQEVYARIEPRLGKETVLASNTSTIPLGRLAAGLRSPERFCGIHFFHPVRERPLVEVVRGPETSDATVASAVAFARSIDKLPVVVGDGPGFLVNRLLVPYLTEALELLLEGGGVGPIEEAATRFGMAKGPLRLMDEIGLDTTLQGGRVLWEAFPERVVASPLLISMVKAGRLGRKSGAGFFEYTDIPQRKPPRRELADLIATWARGSRAHSPGKIVARLLLPMVLEATRLLEEGTVRDPREIDLGAVYGLGFPTARGGLLYWADTIGPARLCEMLGALSALGPRLAPTPRLRRMAAESRRFHDR